MSLIKREQKQYNPFQDLWGDDRLFGLTLFPSLEKGLSQMRSGWFPPIDIQEDKDNLTVTADLPGLREEEIDVAIEDNVLTIRGERKAESEKKDKNYYRMERVYGTFERSFDLGRQVDSTKIKASYKNGVLEIILPKVEQVKPKQIKIDVN